MLHIRSPVTASEIQTLLPQPKSLWLAKSAPEWKRAYLSLPSYQTPTARQFLNNPIPAKYTDSSFDEHFAIKLAVLFLGATIVECHLLSSTINDRGSSFDGNYTSEGTRFWRPKTMMAIQNLKEGMVSSQNPALQGIGTSYLSMIASVFIEDVEVLLGRAGKGQSNSVHGKMQFWYGTQEAREAIWYAGQTLRYFSHVRRPLSSFHIVMVYQAILVLLAYTWLNKQAEVGGVVRSTLPLPTVYLNGDDTIHAEGFVSYGTSIPGLKSGTGLTTFLHNPPDVMRAASEILIVKTRGSEEIAPRLVEGLLKLLNDIAAIISCHDGERDITVKPLQQNQV